MKPRWWFDARASGAFVDGRDSGRTAGAAGAFVEVDVEERGCGEGWSEKEVGGEGGEEGTW